MPDNVLRDVRVDNIFIDDPMPSQVTTNNVVTTAADVNWTTFADIAALPPLRFHEPPARPAGWESSATKYIRNKYRKELDEGKYEKHVRVNADVKNKADILALLAQAPDDVDIWPYCDGGGDGYSHLEVSWQTKVPLTAEEIADREKWMADHPEPVVPPIVWKPTPEFTAEEMEALASS
jgi:hypothetical protein